MPLFACTGHPVIQADNAREAARSFADLLAKSNMALAESARSLSYPGKPFGLSGAHRKLSRPWRYG